jgi:hypothetical protein
MKRSWLIGAALVFSLTAVGCKDDDDDGEDPKADGGTPGDAGNNTGTDAGGIDAGGLDSGLPDAAVPVDSSVPADAATTTTDASGLDAG